MKVFVVGGTGLIGYYTCLELLKQGHEVASLSVPDIKLGEWFPKEIRTHFEDVFKLSTGELVDLFRGYDAMIYSVGPDDRLKIKPPAYDFFFERLVVASSKAVDAARMAGVKKTAVANSYFTSMDRIKPELKLAQRHPYIKCRVEQVQRVIGAGKKEMDVMVLELPYIFGAMPERDPLWKDILFKRLHDWPTIFYPKGGAPMISVRQVAKAFAGAVTRGEHGKQYEIGDENRDWNWMLRIMLDEMGMGHKKIINLPRFLMNFVGRRVKKRETKEGIESGLDPNTCFGDNVCRYHYYDCDIAKRKLGFKGGDLEEAIRESVRASLPL
jgi:nucleoside-diphosphate-sugar epimerase